MKVLYSKSLTNKEIGDILKKPAFDEIPLSPVVQAGVDRMFGEGTTAVEVVSEILKEVREKGDAAVFHYSNLIDRAVLNAETLEVSPAEIDAAYKIVDRDVLNSILRACDSVRRFHNEQLPKSWVTYREHGAILGQSCIPLERVGIYVPGGTATYPSSVIMNAIPAAVAGVQEIIMVVPPAANGQINPHVLVAAREAGVTRIFKVGGAQAIAALAFGTETIPKVDKITGPGNIFVTLAKKAVYGYCDIDMLAGPSEVLIIADSSANPRYIAADLLSQAEHDDLASAILLTDSAELATMVEKEIAQQIGKLSRKVIAQESLNKNGLIIITPDILEAVRLANLSAPEHLEIVTLEPFHLLPLIKNAGAVFLGEYSPEPLGDYLAGPNHVLPTGGTARYFSVLNVEAFMKKSSIIAYTKQALAGVAWDIIKLAETEGLSGHAEAIKVRSENIC